MAAAVLRNSARPFVASPRLFTPASASLFSTSTTRLASGSGAPAAGYRLPAPVRWDQEKESTVDRVGNYFLLTEMMRGMYIVLEQFFRPP
jgi:NADH dehydrogenase (ubiquinone) Fe-S protein 8